MIPRANLEAIDEAVIQQLIGDEVRESRTLDFKDRHDLSRDGKQALAEDVCAFANTVGGDLVFGLTAPDGTAGEIRPVQIENLDDELQRLTNFLRDATEPRVTTALLSRAVPLAGGATWSCYAWPRAPTPP
jgi:predicted HTH transcriptional regulator